MEYDIVELIVKEIFNRMAVNEDYGSGAFQYNKAEGEDYLVNWACEINVEKLE